jgi:CRISPR/Cas system-associated exonuclease Cas4 (RecB family)
LLQRAENVTFIFNSNSEGIRTGEISRFLLRMKYSGVLDPGFQTPGFEIRTNRPLEGKVERTAVHQEILDRQFCGEEKGRLSPTAINMWLSCTMKFYYRYVNNLKEPAKVSAEIDPAMMGNLLHDVMKRIYAGFAKELISRELIDRLINDRENLFSIIRETASGIGGRNFSMKSDGNILITCDILREYVNRILEYDRNLTPFRIYGLEDLHNFEISLLTDGRRVRAGGFIDRIDEVKGSRRIVDYKTGKASDKISSVGDLFSEGRTKDYDAWLQTLFYCEAFYRRDQSMPVRPSVYRIRELKEGYDDRLPVRKGREEGFFVDDYLQVRDDFLRSLQEVVTLIMNNEEPFEMTEDRTKCRTCPYAILCMR